MNEQRFDYTSYVGAGFDFVNVYSDSTVRHSRGLGAATLHAVLAHHLAARKAGA